MAPAKGHDKHSHAGFESHSHDRSSTTQRLIWALEINFVFLLVEFAGGLYTNSLALLSDAGHMLTDVGALSLALFARWLAMRPASSRRTFGYRRAEIIAAFVNALLLWVIVGVIGWEAISRMANPPEVRGGLMTVIAVLGLGANVFSAWLLHGDHEHDINIKGAYVHLIADALGSVAAVVAGVAILAGGSTIVDPIVSVLIGVLILWGSLGLMRESVDILMEATPADMDMAGIEATLKGLAGAQALHDLHVWRIGSGMISLTGHLIVDAGTDRDRLLMEAQGALRSGFGIDHVTLQLETDQLHRFLTTEEHLVQLDPKRPPPKRSPTNHDA